LHIDEEVVEEEEVILGEIRELARGFAEFLHQHTLLKMKRQER
jgi:hypothetical protein